LQRDKVCQRLCSVHRGIIVAGTVEMNYWWWWWWWWWWWYSIL